MSQDYILTSLKYLSLRLIGLREVRIDVPVAIGLRDQTEVASRDAISGVVEVGTMQVAYVVVVGVLLAVQDRVVVHGRRVVNL